MKIYSDGTINRALIYMGYSDINRRMFLARAYDSDIHNLMDDAVRAGFDGRCSTLRDRSRVPPKSHQLEGWKQ